MIEVTADGLRLPRISASGWMPWIAYSRRFDPAGPPARVGLLMIDLGANEPLMQRAIEELPGEVSLAFLPGTPDLPRWLQRARERGHETYLMLPVEDPGGLAERGIKPIETSADAPENLRRLRIAMARGRGLCRLRRALAGAGARSRKPTLRPLIREIADRGLAVVEINPTPETAIVIASPSRLGVGYARSSNILDYKAGQRQRRRQSRPAGRLDRRERDRNGRRAMPSAWCSRPTRRSMPSWPGTSGRRRRPTVSLVPIIGHFECREPA